MRIFFHREPMTFIRLAIILLTLCENLQRLGITDGFISISVQKADSTTPSVILSLWKFTLFFFPWMKMNFTILISYFHMMLFLLHVRFSTCFSFKPWTPFISILTIFKRIISIYSTSLILRNVVSAGSYQYDAL